MPRNPRLLTLKARIILSGHTIASFAPEVGVAVSTMYSVSTGHLPIWPGLIQRCCDYFDTDAAELFPELIEEGVA